MSKCADCCAVLVVVLVVVVKVCGGGDRLGPGTFFKPPLIRASVRGSPGWSELPHWRQSEAVISAPQEMIRGGS